MHCDADMVRAIRLPPQKQLPPRPPEAAGGRQKQPRASQRDANLTHLGERVLALVTGMTRQELYLASTIARTILASQCSAISVPD